MIPIAQLGELRVPRLVLGTMAYGLHRSRAQQIATIHAALDAGLTTVDTAPLYHFGLTETLLGEALRGRPDVQVLGKVGIRWDDGAQGEVMLRTEVDRRPLVARKDSRPAAVRRDVEESLRRLGRERLDGCQVHHPDAHTPLADTIGELLRLREEGKVGAIGVSNMSPGQLDEVQAALGSVPLSSHQLEFSLLHPQGRADLDAASARGVGTLVYSPLHRGALCGGLARRSRLHAHDPRRRRGPFVQPNARRIDAALAHAVGPVCDRTGHTVAEVVLAWVLHQPNVDAVVVGVSSPEQARSVVRAEAVRLRPDEVDHIRWTFAGLALDPHAAPPLTDRVEAKARRVAGAVLRRLGVR